MRLDPRRARSTRGQSVVEFALVLPILLFLGVAILDLGRIYTTMLSVESAAREAADYGTFGSQRWAPIAVPETEAQMEIRGCTAASDLPDYRGPTSECLNPTFSYCLIAPDLGADCVAWSETLGCDVDTREPPCQVRVTMRYTFQLLVPLSFEAFGVRYGIPDSLTFERVSTFAMTDLKVDPNAVPAP